MFRSPPVNCSLGLILSLLLGSWCSGFPLLPATERREWAMSQNGFGGSLRVTPAGVLVSRTAIPGPALGGENTEMARSQAFATCT